MSGIERRANVNRHVADVATGQIRNEHLHRDVVAQAGVLDVLDNPDDFHVGLGAGIGAESDVTAQRIRFPEKLLGEFLVDDDHTGREVIFIPSVLDLLDILDGEVAARGQWNTERIEVSGADGIHVGLGAVTGLRNEAFDRH